MADKNNMTEFTEMEYLFRKYYNENIAKIVSKEYKHIENEKAKEANKIINNTSLLNSLVAMAHPSAAPTQATLQQMTLIQQGEWYNKNSDDLIRGVRRQMLRDGNIKHDIAVMASAWKELAIQKLTPEGYKKLSEKYGGDLAEIYTESRFRELMIEQLARQKMPKNALENIIINGFKGSLFGDGALIKDVETKEVKNMIDKLYNASSTERIATGTLSFLIDMPAFSVGKGWQAGKWTFKAIHEAIQRYGVAAVRKDVQASVAAKGRQAVVQDFKQAISDKGIDVVRKEIRENIITAGKEAVKQQMRKEGRRGLLSTTVQAAFVLGFEKIKQVTKDYDNYVAETTDINANVSKGMTGNPYAMKEAKAAASKVNAADSDTVQIVNSCLLKPVKTPFSQKRANMYYSTLAGITDDGTQMLDTIKQTFDKNGFKVKDTEIPAWMAAKDAPELIDKSKRLLSYVLEMKNSGQDKMAPKLFEKYCQQAYDYARAANADTLMRQQVAAQQQAQAAAYQQQYFNNYSQMQAYYDQMVAQQRQQQQEPVSPETAYNSLSPWKSFMNLMGLDTFGDTGKHFGSVMATLPETMIGMLTGKEGAMKLSDNLISFACIFGGMMVKHPLLKILLLCIGGLGILNRATQHTLGKDAASRQVRPCYKRYDEEEQNPRIQCHKIHGHYLLADIDNSPYKIQIDDATLNAYESGMLPMSTLANEVLRRVDEQRHALTSDYNRNIDGEIEEQQRTVGIR